MSDVGTDGYMSLRTSGSHYNISPFVSSKMWVDVCVGQSDRLLGCSSVAE